MPRYWKHARSEEEAKTLAALGWQCNPDQFQTHHQNWSIRYYIDWEGEGRPPVVMKDS